MNRERTKTLILSFLVILSIMLVHKIWFDSPLLLLQTDASSGREHQIKVQHLRDQVVAPKKAIVGFGGGSRNDLYAIPYTILDHNGTKDVWEESKLLLLDYFTGEPDVELITHELYIENNRRKFVELEFGDSLSSVLVSSVFEVVDSRIIRNIREIKKVLIPVNNTGKIFIVGKDSNIFEVRLEDYQNDRLEEFVVNLEKKDFVRYHPMLNYAGNQTLIPVNYDMPLNPIFVESEIQAKKESTIIEITRRLFNDNFDFVKTIHETSGSRIFLYGYGEKSVRISNRGYLEYKEEVGNASSTNVMEALDIALNFIEEHGGLPKTAYIDKIANASGANKGYYFTFGYSVGGHPIALNGAIQPIEIEVFGNQVKTYRRFIRNEMNRYPFDTGEEVMSPYRIIENNIDLLISDFKTDLEMVSNITTVEIVYHDTLEEIVMQKLTPSWRIVVKDKVYYFDGYKGTLLYSYSNLVN